MTDRLTELLTDEPVPTQLESHDDRRPAVAHWRNELRREVRPEVEALRDRVKALQAALRKFEWSDADPFGNVGYCPLCRQPRSNRHSRNCALRATLEGEATG